MSNYKKLEQSNDSLFQRTRSYVYDTNILRYLMNTTKQLQFTYAFFYLHILYNMNKSNN